jgi:tRNA dimethylallyltransferase
VAPNAELRAELEAFADEQGDAALVARLERVDPASAGRIDGRNRRRVIRALEIVEATGEPVPPLNDAPPDFEWAAVGLRWPRRELYARADRRAERMYAGGLVEETRELVRGYGREFDALTSIGYAEALRVVEGEWTPERAVERTKTATHRLIRMQGTWFREGDERIRWMDAREPEAVLDAVEAAVTAPVR